MITLKHLFPVPRARVWQAWATASSLCQWDPDRVEGEIIAGHSIAMYWDSLGAQVAVDVLSRVEEEELSLRSVRDGGVVQELHIRLQAQGSGHTEVTLEVIGAMSEDDKLGTAAGWHVQLRILERYLLLGAQARTSFAAMGSALCSRGDAFAALRDLGSWLATEDCLVQRQGQQYSIETAHFDSRQSSTMEGQAVLRLSGEVIAYVPGREYALWCSELLGVVRARVLPLAFGGAQLLGVQVIRWGEASEAKAIQDALRAGVDVVIAALSGPHGNA